MLLETGNQLYLPEFETGFKCQRNHSYAHDAALIANTQVQYHLHAGSLNGLVLGTGLRYVGSSNDEQYYAGYKIPSYTLWDAMTQYNASKNW